MRNRGRLEYFDLKNKLENRLNELFLPLKVRESLLQLDKLEGSLNYRDNLISHVRLFYSNCVKKIALGSGRRIDSIDQMEAENERHLKKLIFKNFKYLHEFRTSETLSINN